MAKKLTKKEKLLKHLQSKTRGITGQDALRLYGLYRLSGEINVLRSEGWNIKTEMITREDGTRYARYYL